MAKVNLSMQVEIDLQDAYDRAVAMRNSWAAMAETLANEGRVCRHPVEKIQTYPGGIPSLCKGCGRVRP